MMQKIANSCFAAFSVSYSTRPEFKLRRHSSSRGGFNWKNDKYCWLIDNTKPAPYKWTEIVVEKAFSPLERTFAMSQGFKSLADEWVSGRFESNKSLLETERKARVLPPPSLAP